MKLWQQVLLAAFLGICTGLAFPGVGLELKILGDLFLHLIHMVILPLIFAAVCTGITAIHDPAKLGRIGGKTIFLYATTTMIAVVIGISFATIFKPGLGLEIGSVGQPIALKAAPTISDLLTNLIPKNPVKAFVDGNVLQVIFFSVLFGVSIALVGDKGKPVENLLRAIAQTMFKLTHFVIKLSPFGVFGIMAWAAASFGIKALLTLGHFLLTYYGACLFHVTFVYGGLLLLGRLSILKVLKGSRDACVMAFSTCSSSASLPVALECVDRMGVHPSIANFMLPLGTTINMNGAAIFQGMSALFLCQAYGIELSIHQIVTLVSVATLSSVGSAGIPGTGFIMLSVVLSSVGIPLEGIALIAGVDRLREMVSTIVNILGDIVCTVFVARQEKELNYEQYNSI